MVIQRFDQAQFRSVRCIGDLAHSWMRIEETHECMSATIIAGIHLRALASGKCILFCFERTESRIHLQHIVDDKQCVASMNDCNPE
ncbi:MAG TPA: hypothetical protein VGU61_07885 [Noviherbaspirillum sp.]|jgi:hypothetical protein|uniref:hypothetical protein n=1 Tax=Noviherbaspirillum sp. TaxID=1926288 RepID=UPI002DDD8986|nr:hypothetical protein [Noviherbaspirillum sp.]HEV2610172.1 hypothetical protein [Noviherbaspirillum sp.]